MNRDQLHTELPEPVRRYFKEVARMEPPRDLLDATIAQVETQPRINRFSLPTAFAAAGAAAVILIAIAFGVFNLALGPPTGAEGSPSLTPLASPTEPPIVTPPPLDGLPSAGTVEGRFPVGDAGFPALVAHGSIWLSNGETGVLTRVDPATGQITGTVDANPNPETTRYDQLAVADESFVWAIGADQTLVKIDPTTNQVVERIEIGTLGYRLGLHGDAIWVTDLDNSLTRLDTNTGEVALTVTITSWPGGLGVTDDAVWVTPYQADDLVQLDPQTGDVIDTYDVSSFGMQIVPDGAGALYITGNQERPLERFSIADGRVMARAEEITVTLVGETLYGLRERNLVVIDRQTLEWTAALDLGGAVSANSLLSADGFLWIAQGTDLLKVRPAQ